MDGFVKAILTRWEQQKDYALRLTSDLDDAGMVAQPIPGVVMNHAAWAISHLAVYPPVLAALLGKGKLVDPLDDRYGGKSKPLMDVKEYLPKAALMKRFVELHDEAARALAEADARVLAGPPGLERWRPRMATMHDVVIHLMVHHECVHLGQVSAWRRARGLPPV